MGRVRFTRFCCPPRATEAAVYSRTRTAAIGPSTIGLVRLECVWPAAVSFDDLVDLGHDVDSLTEGDDDLLIVGDVLVRESASLSVFKPLVADLVAADVEVPDLLGHAP